MQREIDLFLRLSKQGNGNRHFRSYLTKFDTKTSPKYLLVQNTKNKKIQITRGSIGEQCMCSVYTSEGKRNGKSSATKCSKK